MPRDTWKYGVPHIVEPDSAGACVAVAVNDRPKAAQVGVGFCVIFPSFSTSVSFLRRSSVAVETFEPAIAVRLLCSSPSC